MPHDDFTMRSTAETVHAHAQAVPACPVCTRTDCCEPGNDFNDGYVRWWCRDCGLAFSHPMAVPEAASYYEGMLRTAWWYRGVHEATRPTRLGVLRRVWDYQTVLGLISTSVGSLLDVGCGNGQFLAVVSQTTDLEPCGIDVVPHVLASGREFYGIQDLCECAWPPPPTDSPIAGRRFDVITFLHVLEHVPDPVGALRTAANYLTPDGEVAVALPTHDWRPNLGLWSADLPPHHLTLWSDRAIDRLIEAAGFETLAVRRSPLRPLELILTLQDRVPLLRSSAANHIMWRYVRRALAPFVAALSANVT